MKVVHLTPHLGGGVGKALSGLVEQFGHAEPGVEHVILCLEAPEKSRFVERVRVSGCSLLICPDSTRLRENMAHADIVQLEFWNHPATLRALCHEPLPPMRLLVWCHVSGLNHPKIPTGLFYEAHRFLFTSECSWDTRQIRALPPNVLSRLGTVSSGGGFQELPYPRPFPRAGLQAGYMGSLNFAKLHPEFVHFLAEVRLPEFRVRLVGDQTNRQTLLAQCRRLGRPDLLEFRGYTDDVAAELAQMDVLAYLLNPEHYGTAENALLEAMAMGVVPVVLDNAAEKAIVQDGVTGLVVRTPKEFADAIQWLAENPRDRHAMGWAAASMVRARFTLERMANAFLSHYGQIMGDKKRTIPFRSVFGNRPAEWFRAFVRNESVFSDDGGVRLTGQNWQLPSVFERTKGSVFHFQRHFPQDAKLHAWAKALEKLR